MKLLLIAMLILSAASCVDTKSIRDIPKEVIAEIIESELGKKEGAFGNIVPKPGESRIDALKRERAEVIGKLASLKASYDAQIEDARAEAIKIKCYWTAGIAFALSVMLCIGAVILRNVPAIRSALGWGAVVFISITLLALGVSWLVDYLKYIILAGVVLIFTIILPNIRKLYETLCAVVAGFEEVKTKAPGYKETMRKYVDDDLNKVVDRIKGAIK